MINRLVGCAVTAPTGIAAAALHGCTTQSWAGIGWATSDADKLGSDVRANLAAFERWNRVKVLIIDEVSILSASVFEKLETIARDLRRNHSYRPFGGIQLILAGDFLQLPPVGGGSASKFAFECKAWDACKLTKYELIEVFRQSQRPFVDMLKQVRLERLDKAVINLLESCVNRTFPDDGITPTHLGARKEDLDKINAHHLSQLKGEPVIHTAEDTGDKATLQTVMPVQTLELKVGAEVMLISNINQAAGLVNGSRGVVTGFNDRLPVVRFHNGAEILIGKRMFTFGCDKQVKGKPKELPATRRQIPLLLAYALTIHKAQGLSLDRVRVDRLFAPGQAYVALSRARSLEGLAIVKLDVQRITASRVALKFYGQLW